MIFMQIKSSVYPVLIEGLLVGGLFVYYNSLVKEYHQVFAIKNKYDNVSIALNHAIVDGKVNQAILNTVLILI